MNVWINELFYEGSGDDDIEKENEWMNWMNERTILRVVERMKEREWMNDEWLNELFCEGNGERERERESERSDRQTDTDRQTQSKNCTSQEHSPGQKVSIGSWNRFWSWSQSDFPPCSPITMRLTEQSWETVFSHPTIATSDYWRTTAIVYVCVCLWSVVMWAVYIIIGATEVTLWFPEMGWMKYSLFCNHFLRAMS